MERLSFEECKNCKDWTGCIVDCLDNCGKPLDALEEFNKYKEIGTVEEFKKALENVKMLSSIYEKLNDQEVAEYHRLSEYEDLEEQGKLLKLPVLVGGTVWDNDFGQPCSYTVTGFSFGKIDDEEENDIDGLQMYYRNYNGSIRCSCAVSEIGKTVFLTKEEAEAALKALQGRAEGCRK